MRGDRESHAPWLIVEQLGDGIGERTSIGYGDGDGGIGCPLPDVPDVGSDCGHAAYGRLEHGHGARLVVGGVQQQVALAHEGAQSLAREQAVPVRHVGDGARGVAPLRRAAGGVEAGQVQLERAATLAQEPGRRPVFVDDFNNYLPCGCEHWVKTKFLNKEIPIPLSFYAKGRTEYEAMLLLQNLALVAQGMGLGGWIHAAFETSILLGDRKSTRLNSSHTSVSRMPSSA